MQEVNAARRTERAMPAMRASALVLDAMPKAWQAIDRFRATRESEVYLSWEEATDIAMSPDCIEDYAEWSFSPAGRSFVPVEAENSSGFRMGKLMMATAGWREANDSCLNGNMSDDAQVSLLGSS